MSEPQFQFPFMETPKPEKQLDLDLSVKEDSTTEEPREPEALNLDNLDRKALEELYFEKVGKHRFFGRTDDEVREAILNPEGEIERLREADKIDDAWSDLGPTGK